MNTSLNLFFILYTLIILNSGCTYDTKQKQPPSRQDSISLIQTALNDTFLTKDADKEFGDKPLLLARYKVIKSDYDLTFNDRKVEIVSKEIVDSLYNANVKGRISAIVPLLNIISEDTAKLSMIFYPGKASFLYVLGKHNGKWKILERNYGKL